MDTGRLGEIFWVFLKLGLISFGGPVAHLGYFREELVVKRKWLEESAYVDVVGLCQFLPGPASSQVVFALGSMRAGWVGGAIASFCFTLPSAVIMIGFSYGMMTMGSLEGAGWLHGLKLAAVAVVAHAVWGMGRKLCPDLTRLAVGIGAAVLLWFFPGAYYQVGVIVVGAFVGWLVYRGAVKGTENGAETEKVVGWVPAFLLALVLVLLVGLPFVERVAGGQGLALFDSFYRAGSLVFGGGHVVLPLLRAEVVPNGWVTDDLFLAGYGAAQALPGPLFTFAAYLGASIDTGWSPWIGGVICLLGVFTPGWLLIAGALPYWHRLRAKVWAQAALRGASAAVVGLLLAAFVSPVCSEGIRTGYDVVAAAIAFALLHWAKAPSWLIVGLTAAAGQWLLP